MSMPTTDGMANSVMSRGMEAVPIRSTLPSPADEARNRSPRGSPAAWRPRQARALPCSCASFNSPSSFFSLPCLRAFFSVLQPLRHHHDVGSPEGTGRCRRRCGREGRPRSSTPVAAFQVAVPAASSMRTARPVRKDEPRSCPTSA